MKKLFTSFAFLAAALILAGCSHSEQKAGPPITTYDTAQVDSMLENGRIERMKHKHQ